MANHIACLRKIVNDEPLVAQRVDRRGREHHDQAEHEQQRRGRDDDVVGRERVVEQPGDARRVRPRRPPTARPRRAGRGRGRGRSRWRRSRAEPPDRVGERVAAVAVVAELVHRGAGGGQQHGVAGDGEPRSDPNCPIHHTSVGVRDLHDGDLGRVSRECLGDSAPGPRPMRTAARSRSAGAEHELVEGRALGQAAGDPHDGVERDQRGGRGVRVGRLRVVDVGDVRRPPRPRRSGGRRDGTPGDRRAPTAGATPNERASAAAASALATLCGANGTTSASVPISAAVLRRSSTNARSTSTSSTTPS